MRDPTGTVHSAVVRMEKKQTFYYVLSYPITICSKFFLGDDIPQLLCEASERSDCMRVREDT